MIGYSSADGSAGVPLWEAVARLFRVRAGIVTAAVASGLALIVAAAQAQAGPPARPNILVIVSDDHSAAFVGAYGNRDVLTPSLDGLAAAGARFDRAYVTAPQCLPSRASFMTGQTPIRIGVSRFTAPVPPEVPMFPEALREAGYFTGLAGRSHHLQGAAHNAEVVEIYRRLGLLSVERRFDVVQEAGGAGGDQQGENALKQFAGFLDRVPPGNRSSCNWGSPTRIVRSTPHDSSRGTTRRS